jgi:hypothetical protein
MRKAIVMALTVLMSGCSMIQSDDNQATEAAVAWGEAFFNCDFHEAEQYCTPESGRWLQFAASNTTQHDLDLLARQGATVQATDYFPEANDTLRVVELRVSHALKPSAPGAEAQQVDEALYHVVVVNRSGSWQVRMAGLPRSEKQSRD